MTTNWAILGKKLGALSEDGSETLIGQNNFGDALEEILGEEWLNDTVDAFMEGRKGSHLALKTVGFCAHKRRLYMRTAFLKSIEKRIVKKQI
jgi:hypothetical protein